MQCLCGGSSSIVTIGCTLRQSGLVRNSRARACGKNNVHDLEPEDLRALTLEASMITGVPLAGTNVVFGGGPGWKKPAHDV